MFLLQSQSLFVLLNSPSAYENSLRITLKERKSTLLPRQKASCTGLTGHMPAWHFSGPSVPPSGKQEHTVIFNTNTHKLGLIT